MKELFDLKIHINGQHIFFLNQSIICPFSRRLRKRTRSRAHGHGSIIRFFDFPGGAEAFELVSRFCYNNGRIPMSPSNICLLHSAAFFLEMDEESILCNLLFQAESFLDGLFYWTWDEILISVRSCEPFVNLAYSSGLLQKLLSCLLGKISANSNLTSPPVHSSPCSSTSTDKTADTMKPCLSKEWWFDDLTILSPGIIEKMVTELESHGNGNKSLIITRFLLHYLKSAKKSNRKGVFRGLAETAIRGVVNSGRHEFTCRGLLWVLRLVSRLEVGKESRETMEWLIGSVIDTATLDDLLVTGPDEAAYDVNLVIRLVRVFARKEEGEVSSHRRKKVGRLMDEYLREISPDQSLKVSKFLAAAESLPDSARDCYDGVYRALDIYLESHPKLSSEERTELCRCLNYEKLTLEACKDLAKNPKIPPDVAVQALASQKSKVQVRKNIQGEVQAESLNAATSHRGNESPANSDGKEASSFNLHKIQRRVIELENACKDMRSQMSKMARGGYAIAPAYYSSRGLFKLC